MQYISTKDLQTLKGKFFQNHLLAPYTSWRVGGAAKYLYQPASVEDLSYFLSLLPEKEKIFWLGCGTNVLIRDQGFSGTIILMQDTLEQFYIDEENLTVKVEAGLPVAKLARACAEKGLSGLEFLAGIPGSAGGALAMNAGAYGHQTWDYVLQVETLDRQGHRRERFPQEYEIGYRSVKFPEDEWFISAILKLKRGDKREILKIIDNLLMRRKQSQPLDLPNAGSVFRNPPNDYAARLIESCELKGFRMGGAKISEKHANFIVNDQKATAKDIEKLIQYIIDVVKQQCNIILVPEVKIIGD